MDEFVDSGPSSAMSLSDYAHNHLGVNYGSNPIGDWFGDTFGSGKAIKGAYQKYLDNLSNYNEWKAVQSARAWEEYFDSTKYQRAVKDLQKAGLNPWLAVQSGVNGSGSTSAKSASYKYNNENAEKSGKSSGTMRDVALLMFAAAKLIAVL